jgi:hypothetical protein
MLFDFEGNGFKLVGKYELSQENEVISVQEKNIKKTERLNLVYILVVNNEIKYIGRTIQGYSRPLNYHKNKVMHHVYSNLHNEIKKGNIVKVHAKKFIDKIPYEGLILDVFEAYETALIKKCNPKWNKQIN